MGLIITPPSVNLLLPDYTTTVPATPASGITPFSLFRAGVRNLSYIDALGRNIKLQPHLAFHNIKQLTAIVNSTTFGVFGFTGPTTGGTLTSAGSLTTTNFLTQYPRVHSLSAATAGNIASFRTNIVNWWRGNATGLGGFIVTLKFGLPVIVASDLGFFGLANTTSAIGATTAPSSLTDIIGVGYDAADTNFFVMNNDSSGTATRTDTGIVVSNNTIYALRLFCLPFDTNVYLSLEDMQLPLSPYEITLSSNLPSDTTFLTWHMHASNNATAAEVRVAFVHLYSQTQ